MKRRLLILTTLTAALVCGAKANAQVCDGYGWGWGYLYDTLKYNVPHFAAFPPVYYSYPVPRTYGYSPFAYPPGVLTPEIAGEVQPLEIINPYVPSAQPTPADTPGDRTVAHPAQPEPLVIINPFVAPEGSVAKTGR